MLRTASRAVRSFARVVSSSTPPSLPTENLWPLSARALAQQQAPLAEANQQLGRERDEAATQLAALSGENERLQAASGEVLKLRGEVTRLREERGQAGAQVGGTNAEDPLTQSALALSAKDYAAAGKRLDEVLADPQAPAFDRRTAQTLLGLVGAHAPATPKPEAKPSP